jgi:hypothetical protein
MIPDVHCITSESGELSEIFYYYLNPSMYQIKQTSLIKAVCKAKKLLLLFCHNPFFKYLDSILSYFLKLMTLHFISKLYLIYFPFLFSV